jgi:glucokinase
VIQALGVYLAGDIGGTRSRLSLFERSARGGARVVRHEVFESRAYPSLEAVVRDFLGKRPPRVRAAAFGVAGPVVDHKTLITNLDWGTIDERALSRRLAIKRVQLLNDLVALSVGALGVSRRKLHVLGTAGAPKNSPKKKGANIAVLAAGTGLGEGMLVWDERTERFVPSPTEGGHTDFAPNDELQDELLLFLRIRFGGHVSWERVLSGNGLGNVYDFFREAKGIAETPENAAAILAAPDRNAAIAELAVGGKSEAAERALELFVAIYGAEAGNLALKTLAVGGVYVCGNIAVRGLSVIDRGGFYRAFLGKGRQARLMERIPLAVVLDTDVGLAGATRVALGA